MNDKHTCCKNHPLKNTQVFFIDEEDNACCQVNPHKTHCQCAGETHEEEE